MMWFRLVLLPVAATSGGAGAGEHALYRHFAVFRLAGAPRVGRLGLVSGVIIVTSAA
jgi:hypothetical protein